jgi:hypothetical protein
MATHLYKSSDQKHTVIIPSLHGSIGHPDNKRLGEASEAEFVARATSFDFHVAKPWGEDDPYDVIVGFGQGFWRVQVKCASYHSRSRYRVKASGARGRYTKDQIDFLAGYVVPENIWYIVPIAAFEGRCDLHFCPHGAGEAKYERYREAWCLFTTPATLRGWNDIPERCRCPQLPVRCAVCPCRK